MSPGFGGTAVATLPHFTINATVNTRRQLPIVIRFMMFLFPA
jgi:hypothetical protein